MTLHILFIGAVFVPTITYYGGSTMFSRLCGTVYSVNNIDFRLWAPFNTGGEMQFIICFDTVLYTITKNNWYIYISKGNLSLYIFILFEPILLFIQNETFILDVLPILFHSTICLYLIYFYFIYYTPRKWSWGVYMNHLVRPSVCLYVRPSVCTLLHFELLL